MGELHDSPLKLHVPLAAAREALDLAAAGGGRRIAGELFRFGAGSNVSLLLAGLDPGDRVSAHWGYLLRGELAVRYPDASGDTLKSGDLFYLPPGPSVRALADSELFLFSPLARQQRRQLEGISPALAEVAEMADAAEDSATAEWFRQ